VEIRTNLARKGEGNPPRGENHNSMNLRPVRALRELDRQLDELSAADRAAREWARFELAKSASRYTRQTKRVVDETMTLSATMMRAGEVAPKKRH
jgi:hypothetical protein